MYMTRRIHLGWGLATAVVAGLAFGLAAPAVRAAEPAYRITGPFTHDNLTIFLLHGQDEVKDRKFLILDEAIKAKKVIVHETRDPNLLSIQNDSTQSVFVQAGDIVKG